MGKVLTSMKFDPWMLAALDMVREKNPKVLGRVAPHAFPERVKTVTTRTWIVEQLVENFLEKHGMTQESPEVVRALKDRHLMRIR